MDFANKRQFKHTSTILEPSIPFHTLVKLVDAEDIANDKIRAHDLHYYLMYYIIMIELLHLHITPGLVMTTITEILAYIVHHIDLLIDHLTDVIHVTDTNLDLTPEIILFKDTLPLIDQRPNLEILDVLDLAHILI